MREKGRVEAKRRYDGFAIAIPDVIDLRLFVDRFLETLHTLALEPAPPSGRPSSAIVELPSEGGLFCLIGIERPESSSKRLLAESSDIQSLALITCISGPKKMGRGWCQPVESHFAMT